MVIPFKMTEQVEQRICIKCWIKLELAFVETVRMIQKAAAVDDWWLSSITTMRALVHHISHSAFCETSSPPGDSAPWSPDLVSCDFCLFPKLKSPLTGKRFQTVDEIQENMMGQLMKSGRTVWGPKVPTLKGTQALLLYIQCFLYLVSSSISVFIFHITWLDTFWTVLVHTSQ